jgi:hypothetical protein
MEPTPGTPPPSSAGDWPARATDQVEVLVTLLRDKTVRPVALVARAIVFGILVFAAALVTVVLVSVSLVRILTVYVFGGRVWLSDLVVGALFVAVGLVAWSQRRDPTTYGPEV